MGLFSIFKKHIKVDDDKLQNVIFYAYPARKTRRVKINTELTLGQNQICVFSTKHMACDTFTMPNTYQINANSLPTLFKKAGFNKPNSKGKVATKYTFNVFFASNLGKYCQVKIKNALIKDNFYGKQKATFIFNVNFNISSASDFLNALFTISHNLTNANMQKVTSKLFAYHIKKYIAKRHFTLGDAIHYTHMVHDEMTKELSSKFDTFGVKDLSITLEDVILKADLERDIIFNKHLPSYMQKEVDKFDKKKPFTISRDGVPINVTYDVPEHYSHNSLAQKYSLRGIGIINQKDDAEYTVTTLAGGVDEYGKPTDKKITQSGKYCLYCNKLIPMDSVFCPYCCKEQ